MSDQTHPNPFVNVVWNSILVTKRVLTVDGIKYY
jgi:hypothetical protein